MKQAAALSSGSPLDNAHVSWMLYHAGQHQTAYDLLSKSASPAEDFTVAYLRGRILAELGRLDEAAESLNSIHGSDRIPIISGCLAYVYSAAGRRADAECVLDELKSYREIGYISPPVTIVEHSLGYPTDARKSLERARSDYSYSLIWNAVDPQLSRLCQG